MGFSDEIILAVKALTRGKLQSYSSYLEQVCKNPIAKNAKLADVKDNANPKRLEKLNTITKIRLKNKYDKAIAIIKKHSDQMDATR